MAIPERTCMVCRKKQPKHELVRIVKNKNGDIFLDSYAKADGRGAYICKSCECYEKLLKTKALNRAFHLNVSSEVYEKLINELKNN